jgi:ferredoxin-NADP reductase
MKLTLASKKSETPNVTTFEWEPEASLAWKAGQYLHYALPHEPADDRGAERWFTISSAPFEGRPHITTRHAEKSSSFKAALFALEPGAQIEADGPEGDFTLGDGERDFVFIAGGIGITPFRSILAELAHRGEPIQGTLLYANRDAQFVFKDELDAIAAHNPGFDLRYFGENQPVDEALVRANVPDLAGRTFYVSGPQPMVEALAKTLSAMGVPAERQKHDDFPGYEWK